VNDTGESCPVKGGDRVLHVVWDRFGVVDSTRELAKRQKGSKWMVRVKWEGGGWGTDGNANFMLVERPKVRRYTLGEHEEVAP
jgi:hypothetical protein